MRKLWLAWIAMPLVVVFLTGCAAAKNWGFKEWGAIATTGAGLVIKVIDLLNGTDPCATCEKLPTEGAKLACRIERQCCKAWEPGCIVPGPPAPLPTGTPACNDSTGPVCNCFKWAATGDVYEACPIVDPTPTQPPRPTPTASPAPHPQPSAATPTPVPWGFVTRVRIVQGFSGCNPRTPNEAARTERVCHGDRTYQYFMPSEGSGPGQVPKYAGMSCEQRPGTNRWYRVEGFQFNNSDGTPYYTCGRFDETKPPKGGNPYCFCRDDAQSPCGGAPVCEKGRFARCERLRIGCNGQEWDAAFPGPGSELEVDPKNGAVTCDNGDGFRFTCRGVPGAKYKLTARLYKDARTGDGREIQSQNQGEFSREGTW